MVVAIAKRLAGGGAMTDYAEILSFGGGINSVALAIMAINDGWRGKIVFSDTGCEWPETYSYMDYFEREWLKPRGFEIVRLSGLPWQTKKKGYSLIEYCEMAHIIPLAARRWCTSGWKVKPVERFRNGNAQMLGIAADEAHRKPNEIRPLVEANVTREGCIEIINAEGLNIPQKSGCYICPFQRDSQWRMLWERHPELFERAMLLEENAIRTQAGRHFATLDPNGKITLRQRKLVYESQMTLPDIDMNSLLRIKPCILRREEVL